MKNKKLLDVLKAIFYFYVTVSSMAILGRFLLGVFQSKEFVFLIPQLIYISVISVRNFLKIMLESN